MALEGLELPDRSRGERFDEDSAPALRERNLDFRVRAFTENPTRSSSSGLRQRAAERINSEPREREAPGLGMRMASQIRGLYLVKFAVSVTACYLTIQLLITFSEVLLPFIFAVLVMIVLEPVKKFTMRALCRLAVRAFQFLHMDFCVEGIQVVEGIRHPSIDSMEGQMYAGIPEDEDTGTALPSRVAMPVATVKRMLVAVSILYCLACSGRVFWLVGRIFFSAAAQISADMQHYKAGAARLKSWIKMYISGLHIESLDFHAVLEELVLEVENVGSVLTTSFLSFLIQSVVTFIFLIYMLWSPVKMDGSAMASEVFTSTGRYLKVKFVVSTFTGLAIGLLLHTIGLDLPLAFGLLSFLCNFLPGIGSPVASAMPCLLAMIDVRKTPTQVALAFVLQLIVHFFIDFVLEPVVFGISVEIHSVIVILGIWFFYQVWGVPGMLLSVPLLAVTRMMIKSVKFPNSGGGEDQDTSAFFDNVFAGRWMSSVGETRGEEEMDEHDLHLAGLKEEEPVEAQPVCGEIQKYEDLWTVLQESPLAQELRQWYLRHQMILDLCVLTSVVAVLALVQVG